MYYRSLISKLVHKHSEKGKRGEGRDARRWAGSAPLGMAKAVEVFSMFVREREGAGAYL